MSNKLDLNDVEDLKLSSQYLDLLSERVNGRAIACSDDWFASCENLVKSGRGVFEPATFVSTGQVMDGWESRRSFARHYRRAAGAEQRDWCVLRMGLAGRIRYFDIDTNQMKTPCGQPCWNHTRLMRIVKTYFHVTTPMHGHT